jgi:hypothetical protein
VQGSTAIYALTDFFEPFGTHGAEKAIDIETAQGINIAKAASKTTTLKHFVWSTLPNGGKITGGKYLIPHFVAKNQVDDYIKKDKALLAKTTFLWITFYGNNYQYPMFTPNFVVSQSDSHYSAHADSESCRKPLELMFSSLPRSPPPLSSPSAA